MNSMEQHQFTDDQLAMAADFYAAEAIYVAVAQPSESLQVAFAQLAGSMGIQDPRAVAELKAQGKLKSHELPIDY